MNFVRNNILILLFVVVLSACSDDDTPTNGSPDSLTPSSFLFSGARLSKIADRTTSEVAYVFDYDNTGMLSSIQSPSLVYDVSPSPFTLAYTSRAGLYSDRWNSFRFNADGQISQCHHLISSSDGSSCDIAFSLNYQGRHLLSVYASGTGFATDDSNRLVAWSYNQSVTLTWRDGNITLVSMSESEQLGGTTLNEHNYSYDFTYGSTANNSHQYTLAQSDPLGQLQVFAVLGLLGDASDRIPTSCNIVYKRNVVNGQDLGYETESILLRVSQNANSTISSESSSANNWLYSYQ